MVKTTTVEGSKKQHSVMLYALSTCVWCRKTRRLLESLGVCYDYVYVDQLTGTDEREAMDRVYAHNPSGSFPTMVIDENTVIVGYKDRDITRELS